MISFSIIICTYNRFLLLPKLVEVFDKSVHVPDEYTFEIIVVDNNSSDETRKTVETLIAQKRRYEIKYVLEKKPGLSHARNAGIRAARYDLIGFIDDDIIPHADYLKNIAVAVTKNPGIKCLSNRILLKHSAMPSWVKFEGRHAVINRGGYDLGSTRLLEDSDMSPIGASMFFHKSVFARYGEFDPGFGYDFTKSDMVVPGEESLFYEKIRNQVPILYVHEAVVDHIPVSQKYDKGFLCRFYRGIGYWYGSVDAGKLKTGKVVMWLGYPRAYYLKMMKSFSCYCFSRLSASTTARNFYEFLLNETIGNFRGFRDFRR